MACFGHVPCIACHDCLEVIWDLLDPSAMRGGTAAEVDRI